MSAPSTTVKSTVPSTSIGSTSLAEVPDNVAIQPVELTAQDGGLSRGILYTPKGRKPKVGVHFMHPRTDQGTNYNILPLVQAGCVALGRAGRWPNNDNATIHETLLLDMAAGVRRLQEAGCEQIVLVGNSGGGTMATLYQEQASAAPGQRLTHTAGGDPLDLNAFDLPAADGLCLIGAHIGQGGVLGKMIDGAVVDEADPLATDPDLDIYDPRNGFVTPPASSHYDPAFLARYKVAQAARVRRIDQRALALIDRGREAQEVVNRLGAGASLAQQRAAKIEHTMVVYRTTAYPAFVDTGIESGGRNVASYFGAAPHFENFNSSGFARYVTARAWLSTWSVNHSRANTIKNLAGQTKPVIIVHYAGDCGTRLSEAHAMLDAAAATDKTLKVLEGIDHYGMRIMPDSKPAQRAWDGTQELVKWVRERFALD